MTASATAAPPAAAVREPFFRRHRATLVITVGALVAVAIAAYGAGPTNSTPLDPGNAGPDGARALARVLDRDGVVVEVARDAAALEALTIGPDTTLAVVLPQFLGEATSSRMLAHSAGAAQVLVLGAGLGPAEVLGAGTSPSYVNLATGREAECEDPLFAGLTLEVDGSAVYEGGECFPDDDLGAVVLRPAPRLMFFGADQALTNDQILRADNAAIALRLLGQTPRLVWYVPSLTDLDAGDGVSARDLLPRWLWPGLWLLALTMVAVIIWRARRLGPLATEPLPVVVRAVETTRSLGRLYRRAGDRGHAAAALRRAARTRCAERLRAGSRIDDETVIREVARRTGRPLADVTRLLDPDPHAAPPASDADLITLAQDLAQLDREVRRT
ncbi:DUF4350 domain-containing protein [Nocardioides sp.]|uniref:DUF4350 domain-containing protein n=1 Tax=Nocardioides sp. TaxID=35761 RepID=UPI003561689B